MTYKEKLVFSGVVSAVFLIIPIIFTPIYRGLLPYWILPYWNYLAMIYLMLCWFISGAFFSYFIIMAKDGPV